MLLHCAKYHFFEVRYNPSLTNPFSNLFLFNFHLQATIPVHQIRTLQVIEFKKIRMEENLFLVKVNSPLPVLRIETLEIKLPNLTNLEEDQDQMSQEHLQLQSMQSLDFQLKVYNNIFRKTGV